MIKSLIKVACCGICAVFLTALWQARIPGSPDDVVDDFKKYHASFLQEKVYVHHDKSRYVLGERIWCKVYLVDAIFHQDLTPSQQVYVELVDPNNEVLISQLVRIENGGAATDFLLKPRWPTGVYQLRAYSNYMRNFDLDLLFQKEFRVYDAYADVRSGGVLPIAIPHASDSLTDSIHITFYPEGGDLVQGLKSKVALEISGENPGRRSGTILDGQGNIVARFTTHESGLGFFLLTPSTGSYYAQVDGSDQKISLPEVKSSGYALAMTSSEDTIEAIITTTSDGGLEGAYLIGHLRGQLFGVIDQLSGSNMRLRIPMHDLPDGVLHFTLFDANDDPVCERLLFHYNAALQPSVEISTNKSTYSNRDKVLLDVEASDLNGEAVLLNGSVSVTDLRYGAKLASDSDIRTYLLLESDIGQSLDNPGQYFNEASRSAQVLLDLLMMTKGWRRFDWATVRTPPRRKMDWPPANDISISGYVSKVNNADKPVRAHVFLSTLSEDFLMQEKLTNDKGRFVFDGFHFLDSLSVLLQADLYNEKDNAKEKRKKREAKSGKGPVGNRNVDIHLDLNFLPLVKRGVVPSESMDAQLLRAMFADSRKLQIVDSLYSDMLSVQLDEVEITGKKFDADEYYDRPGMLYSTPDNRLILDSMGQGSLATNVFDLIRGQFPGVEVVGSFPNKTVRIRGRTSFALNTTALILLDGIPIEPALANVIPVHNIAFVDVIRTITKTAAYGAEGRNGILAIYRRQPGERITRFKTVNGILQYTHPGYYRSIDFASPDYGRLNDLGKPDFRTTLFWEPQVRTDENGSASLEFYTADRASLYLIQLEGITKSGQPVVVRKEVRVE